jgi:ribonucleoside-triphosphate reductase (formate)
MNRSIEYIRKRNGQVVDFQANKIQQAIAKAGAATGEFGEREAGRLTLKVIQMIISLGNQVISPAYNGPTVCIEDVQDIVERVLLDSPFYKTAKAYIIYREQHARIRQITNDQNAGLMKKYIQEVDWKVKENSNMSYSLQGLNNFISSDITAQYWLNQVYPEKIRDAHTNGDLHIHDLSSLAVYCVGWDLQDLFLKGFTGVSGKVESKPPKHFRSALGQIVNFFYTLQGEAAGAQALSNFDTLLAPFIRADGLDYKSVKQAMQEFIFNINVPTRVGFQTPFTNITMDLVVPVILADSPVIIGGEYRTGDTYADYQKEMDMINAAFADVMMEGDAKGRVFTFPIPTYNITKDFDWDNPNLDNLWKMTGKYGIPYFSNFINSDMSPDDARSMCCRLRLDNRELHKRGGGLFGANPLTGSIGVVTLNLPRIGYLAKDEAAFLKRLDDLVQIAAESLTIKRKILENFTDGSLYPYSKFYLRKIKEKTGKFWTNHFSTIGILGMSEACLNFMGKDIASPKGQSFAVRVMDHMRKQIETIQAQTGEIYNLEATPAEGTSYRFAIMDKKQFSGIICANEKQFLDGGDPFYTNSTQLPVNHTDDLFETLDLQDELQIKYTGGTVQHLFLGEQVTDISTVKKLIRTIANGYRLPYFTLTPTFSVCPNHGYIPGEYRTCAKCGADTEVYSRVVGYLRPVKQWNNGKQAEFYMRKTSTIKQKETQTKKTAA